MIEKVRGNRVVFTVIAHIFLRLGVEQEVRYKRRGEVFVKKGIRIKVINFEEINEE